MGTVPGCALLGRAFCRELVTGGGYTGCAVCPHGLHQLWPCTQLEMLSLCHQSRGSEWLIMVGRPTGNTAQAFGRAN